MRQARTRRLDGLVGSATISMSQAISTILGLHHLLRPNIIRCTWKQAPSNRGRPGPASPPCSATSCAWGVSRSGGRWLPSATCSETSSSGVAGPAGRRLGSPWPCPGWPRASSGSARHLPRLRPLPGARDNPGRAGLRPALLSHDGRPALVLRPVRRPGLEMQAAFYGVGAAVIGIIALTAEQLAQLTL